MNSIINNIYYKVESNTYTPIFRKYDGNAYTRVIESIEEQCEYHIYWPIGQELYNMVLRGNEKHT